MVWWSTWSFPKYCCSDSSWLSKTANFGLGILKDTPLIVSFALSQTVNQKGKQKSGQSKAHCVSSYPPAPHAPFHTTLLQLHVNSLAVSYAFQLTAAGYKPRVIFHEQTLWSCSWCPIWWREEESMLQVSSWIVSCCSLWSPYGFGDKSPDSAADLPQIRGATLDLLELFQEVKLEGRHAHCRGQKWRRTRSTNWFLASTDQSSTR